MSALGWVRVEVSGEWQKSEASSLLKALQIKQLRTLVKAKGIYLCLAACVPMKNLGICYQGEEEETETGGQCLSPHLTSH